MTKKYSAGQTWTEGEVQLLEFITNTMLRGGDPRVATRHKEFASVCRKVRGMKDSTHRRKAAAEGKPAPELPEGVTLCPDCTGDGWVFHMEERDGQMVPKDQIECQRCRGQGGLDRFGHPVSLRR